MLRGKFISFEGIDNSGKSTQLKILKDWLEEKKIKAVFSAEPDSSFLGKKVREIVITHREAELCAESELLLFFAARIQHYKNIIEPALKNNTWVICDRFYDSSIAYQGYGGEVCLNKIYSLIKIFLPRSAPDLTFWFEMKAEVAKNRKFQKHSEFKDNFEDKGESFLDRVNAGYKALYENLPKCEWQSDRKIVRLDAEQDRKFVAKLISKHLEGFL